MDPPHNLRQIPGGVRVIVGVRVMVGVDVIVGVGVMVGVVEGVAVTGPEGVGVGSP